MRTLPFLFALLLPVTAFSQEPAPSPSPSPTPFPEQDRPPGDWRGYDEAIQTGEPTPTPAPTPDPFAEQIRENDEFFQRKDDDKWDAKRAFPGNYAALPLTLDVGFRPCLECSPGVNVYDRPGEASIWVGYAFQPYARTSSPFLAGGFEWIGGEWVVGEDFDRKFRGRSQLRPTWRFGWNFTAASVYASTGVILPDKGRTKIGYHVGAGVSSIAMLAVSVCAGEAIPSVLEVGYDFEEDLESRKVEDRFVLKVGWGF